MATPTLFSDKAANAFVAKNLPQNVMPGSFDVTVPAATAADTLIGLYRFQKGFSLMNMAISVEDLDTGATVTLSFGYVYDDNTIADDVPDAFYTNIGTAQGGGKFLWPVSAGQLTGESFVAEDSGYLSVTVTAGPTTTQGDIKGVIQFTYDL